MAKFSLEIEYDFNFILIGISSHEKDYRLCWAINNQFGIDLNKTEDLEIKEKKQMKPSHFAVFGWYNEETYTEYYILSNRSEKGMLIPEHKQADYFLMVRGSDPDATVDNLIKKLKEINLILTAYPIEVNNLKSKQNLVF